MSNEELTERIRALEIELSIAETRSISSYSDFESTSCRVLQLRNSINELERQLWGLGY